jgi:hypothetical protein
MILAIAAQNNWEIDVFDFHGAYLNGKLDEGGCVRGAASGVWSG